MPLASAIFHWRPKVFAIDYFDWGENSKIKDRYSENFLENILNAIGLGHVEWVVVPHFKDKSSRGMLFVLKKLVGLHNAINAQAKIQILPLTLLEAAARLFYLNSEFRSTAEAQSNPVKLLASSCLDEVQSNLSKDNPFLVLGLEKSNFSIDSIFTLKALPVMGYFTRGSVDENNKLSDYFIPSTQLDKEDKLFRQLLPLWQKLMDPLLIDVCGKPTNFASFHYVDERNTTLKNGLFKKASAFSNLDYIDPDYTLKDQLLR
jgi:hypothetical protein